MGFRFVNQPDVIFFLGFETCNLYLQCGKHPPENKVVCVFLFWKSILVDSDFWGKVRFDSLTLGLKRGEDLASA